MSKNHWMLREGLTKAPAASCSQVIFWPLSSHSVLFLSTQWGYNRLVLMRGACGQTRPSTAAPHKPTCRCLQDPEDPHLAHSILSQDPDITIWHALKVCRRSLAWAGLGPGGCSLNIWKHLEAITCLSHAYWR